MRHRFATLRSAFSGLTAYAVALSLGLAACSGDANQLLAPAPVTGGAATAALGGGATAQCASIAAVMGVAITPVTIPIVNPGTFSVYQFSATGLPAGLSMSIGGTISGTPTVSGTFNYTVNIDEVIDLGFGDPIVIGNLSFTCTVVVNGPPTANCLTINAIDGSPLPSGLQMVGSGGSGAPYTFSATGLPAGVSMSSSGVISGTPTETGTFSYTVTITDSQGHTGTVNCSLTVSAGPNATCLEIVAVKGSPLPSGLQMVGGGGTGGPYTFSATGLPTGITMATDGTVSGTPTVTGTFNYTVTITDKDGNTGTINCSVTVLPPPTANCVAITGAVAGTPITPVTMVGSGGVGGPYTFSATGLPAGLSMSTSGTISGTPTVSGTFNYTVTVTDAQGNGGSVNCSVTVQPPPSTSCVSITAVKGVAITPVTMVGSGGTGGPYTFSATGLPAGLSMSTGGTISGTPSVSGNFNYTVTVTDNAGNSSSVNCSVTVLPPPSTSCVSITAVKGLPITPVTMVGSGGTGGPYTFSATGLPAGLSMSTGGTISGTPSVNGNFNYTVTVTDNSGNSSSVNCAVTVQLPPPPVTSCVSITAIQGAAITPVTMTGSGGTGGPYTFSATGLPTGLSMSSSGTISGTPTVSGTFSYTVTVADNQGNTGSVNCSVTVTPPPAGGFTTYTQGGWGAKPAGNNPGMLLKNKFAIVYPSGVFIGGTRKLTFTSASAIEKFLPQGSTPGVLNANATNPTTSSAGVFAGQVLALQLSVSFSNAGITKPGLAALKAQSGPLAGQTVAQILALANAVIGGAALPSGLSISSLNDVIDKINNNFDNGTQNNGYLGN